MSLNREKLEKKFREEYEKLNEMQRKAVDRTEGPVMVIAGPGTGKTQILASRIGKILLDTDAQAENILCLTYTDSGAVAMRKRLLQFIGADAYKINICTFHAFCNDVIQDNLSLFEKTALDPITDLEKIQLFKELIDKFPKNHPLKRYRGDVYFEVNNLQSLFSTMKREGWTPAFLHQKIDAYLADLPNRDEFIYKRKYKEFNAGDLKKDKIAEETARMEKLRAAVDEFEHFQQLMRKKNRYDFDDMINWVIRAFEENKNLLAGYQEKYQYILVDEYQDTSGTQNRIVELLISYWDNPNVFVVGDDDQSIYRFQGANVQNMMDFAGQYSNDLLTVVLTRNYRSTQPILDISKQLIDNNGERLVKKIPGLSKELVASNAAITHLTHPPLVREYETPRQEMIGIVHSIQELLAQGVTPARIGIIYKENKYGDELARYFNLLKIPVYTRRQLNLLQVPLVRKIITLLRYLVAEHDVTRGGDELLFEILHYDWFGVAPAEMAVLSMEVAARKSSGQQTSIRLALAEKIAQPARDLFAPPPVSPSLQKAASALEALMADLPNLTLQQLVENCIRKAGIITRIMLSDNKHQELQMLMGFFDFVKEESRRNPRLDAAGLVALLDMMEQEAISLPLAQVSGSDKGINLMTAHGSKGLEFQYVFFAGANAGYWEKKRKPSGGYKMPDTLFNLQAEANDMEELRRLFYVALTRAEQHLYISYARYKNDGKDLEPSMFIAEIQDQVALPAEKIIIDPEVLSQFTVLEFENNLAPEIAQLEEAYIQPLLDKFVLSATALNNYLRCPLEFYFKQLVRIPSPRNEATEFGSAVHYALEKLFRKMLDQSTAGGNTKGVFASKEEFIGDFAWYMNRHRESFTKEQFDRRMEQGEEVLGNYYDKYIGSFHTIVAIERNIRNVHVKGVPLKGKLDKLEFDGKSVNVVDYKTGDPDKAMSRMKGPSEKNPIGGDYWRQAVFYKLLVDNYEQRGWKAVSTEFDFIEPDNKKQYRREKLVITPADITAVTEQIRETWDHIQARDFYTGCGKPDCHWCNFVKTNEMTVALHEVTNGEEEND